MARLRTALDRWSVLPPGDERDRLTRELIAALRALPLADAQRLSAEIYRAFRAESRPTGRPSGWPNGQPSG